MNADGPQRPLNQRPELARAIKECKRLQYAHLARTQQSYRPIHRSQQVRQRKEQQFEGGEDFDNVVDPKTGWRSYKESLGNLPTASSSSSHWDQTHQKTSNWDSKHSSRPDGLVKNHLESKPDGEWDKTTEGMMLHFAESGHPVFRVSSFLERRELKSKRRGVKTIHFNGSDETIELVLRTVISVNQLSVHGAAPDFCKELARDSAGAMKPAANENLDTMVIPK